MGFFSRWLDKNAINSFKEEMNKNAQLPIECRIIVAEWMELRYTNTLKIMKDKEKILLHLHTEGKDAGARLSELQDWNDESWLHICKLGEASLSQALYHCLQSDDVKNIEFANAEIMNYFLSMKSMRGLYKSEIENILEGKM